MSRVALLAVLALALAGPAAQAQVQLDMAKVTCIQFATYKITDPRNLAIWLSGYYQGKRNSTTIDTQALIASADKLRDFCILNPSEPVLRASEKFLAPPQ
jgi:acid stress chaperone HdeB